ncbi:hypothetical protein J1N35_013816 [Gossypium stocksii]|uniref:Uncharacterized protein n=1 Tax=Gossypium stocksii TaxID=47602 RepID=A0A9D3VT38_9ROSI|nr:hypothetical protein J1N35_013816 [Gossypium stocksii]
MASGSKEGGERKEGGNGVKGCGGSEKGRKRGGDDAGAKENRCGSGGGAREGSGGTNNRRKMREERLEEDKGREVAEGRREEKVERKIQEREKNVLRLKGGNVKAKGEKDV